MPLIGLAVVLALGVVFAAQGDAQQTGKIPRLCFLTFDPSTLQTNRFALFFQGLRDLGYVHNKTIHIDYLSADGRNERFPTLAAECVRLKADVVVVSTTPAAQAAKEATGTIPIVMIGLGDPVGTGLVASLARPGGNVTGFTIMASGLSAKRLELLKAAAPRTVDDLPLAFDARARERADGVITTAESIFNVERRRVAQLAVQHRLPGMYPYKLMVEAGGLMAYDSFAPNLPRAAAFVDKILKGAKPADLPVEQPTKFELVINLKTAKALGLTIPQSVLVRADQVIE